MITAGGIGIFVDELLIQAIGSIGTSLTLLTAILLYLFISFDITFEKITLFIEKIKPKESTDQEDESTSVFSCSRL